ncbi:MAG TPA: UdgX family uracil-DNA binding protein [Burkholderiales bacterium]|nr:UdgX family uracil-DNA binding protein [Burkholderiales bacterium]
MVSRRDPLDELRRAASECRACPLWRDATQTVFGEGRARAPVVLVGEQPGDAEDRTGRPFVGPAGRLLDEALAAAGLDRASVYVTNAVKHFKWTLRGKRRVHKTPAQREIEACQQWLARELATIAPRLVVCLGSTALRVVLGRPATVGSLRGRIVTRPGEPALLVTVHPSYVLRVPPEKRGAALHSLVADLRIAARFIARG